MKIYGAKIFRYLLLSVALLLCAALVFHYEQRKKMQRREERFVSAIAELSIAQQMFGQLPESYDSAKNEILTRNEFEEEDFLTLERNYKEKPERWVEIWHRVVQKLEEAREEKRREPINRRKPPTREKPVPP